MKMWNLCQDKYYLLHEYIYFRGGVQIIALRVTGCLGPEAVQ